MGFTRYQGFDPHPNGEFVRGLLQCRNFGHLFLDGRTRRTDFLKPWFRWIVGIVPKHQLNIAWEETLFSFERFETLLLPLGPLLIAFRFSKSISICHRFFGRKNGPLAFSFHPCCLQIPRICPKTSTHWDYFGEYLSSNPGIFASNPPPIREDLHRDDP